MGSWLSLLGASRHERGTWSSSGSRVWWQLPSVVFRLGVIQTHLYPEHHLQHLAQKSLARRLLLLRKQSGITKGQFTLYRNTLLSILFF